MTREDRFLQRILGELPQGDRGFPGPGDDAAGFSLPEGALGLLTTDAAEEGIHFDRLLHPIRSVGRRAVAAAVSDIAAMGGAPLAVLFSQVAPAGEQEAARLLFEAAAERAAELGARVAGGNLCGGARLAVHVTVLGALSPRSEPLTRTGARPGDSIHVSGPLGGSALGLRLLREKRSPLGPEEQRLVERHLDPAPRLRLGQELSARRAASAAMDLSDGLALDLSRLAEASGVGAEIEAAHLPLAGEPDAVGLEAALEGGEDYELLFTSSDPEAVEAAAGAARIEVHRIGTVTAREKGVLLSGPEGRRPLAPRGWDALALGPRCLPLRTRRQTG